ncbi:MAG: hypothetical protein PVH68_20125 [Armatimonadota bacterium]
MSEVGVPLDGREVALPLPWRAQPEDTRVVLRGAFKCSYDGRSYDAVNTAGESGAFERQHHYVRWSPAELAVAEYAPSTHECVLHFPEDAREIPESVGARVDVDRFVTDFIITPSEVRESLSGDLRLEVWRARRPSRAGPLLILGLIGATAVAIVLVRRRRLPLVDMSDVEELLGRIDRKYQSATGTVEGEREDAFELSSELERLRDGSRELARHIEAFRGAALTVDRRQLDREIADIEGQLEDADRDDVRQEIEATLATKRKLRDLLADSDASEARYLLRLSKIESTIDATTMRVTGQEQRLADEVHEDRAIAELEEELKSLDEAIEELKVVN